MEKLSKALDAKSRKLVKALRHDPTIIGLKLDENGWANFSDIVMLLDVRPTDLMNIILLNDKQRFEHDPFNAKVRAAQGHSIDVKLDLEEYVWPDGQNFVYHGTNRSVLGDILSDGVKRMKRDMVHMHSDQDATVKVAKRHGSDVVILKIDLERVKYSTKIYKSSNDVILAKHIPPSAIVAIIDPNEDSDETSQRRTIISNKMMTPDGTVLESTNRHDYVSHTEEDGEYYAVDGGKDYLKRAGNYAGCIELSVYSDAIHEVKRHNARWGGRGKDGTSEVEWKKIADMSDDHILNVLLNVKGINPAYYVLFLDELKYRKLNDIVIED